MIERSYPAPGNRAAIRVEHREVNGLVTKVEITAHAVWITVRVDKKKWGTRREVYRVSRPALSGWSEARGHIKLIEER